MSRKALFAKVLRPNQILTGADTLEKYNVDWTGLFRGASDLALLPRTTDELSGVLRICHQHRLPVATHGGNTSLVGGATPLEGEIVLSTERMTHFDFEARTGLLQSEAGVVLQTVQEALEPQGFETPYSLGARGSCTIGGNIATCAGGINFVKYGSLRGYVLGLEVVVANGEVLDLLKAVQKDNTGLDMKQLFIGGLTRL